MLDSHNKVKVSLFLCFFVFVFGFFFARQELVCFIRINWGADPKHLAFSPSHLGHRHCNYRMIQPVSQGHLNIYLSWLMGLVAFLKWILDSVFERWWVRMRRPIDHVYWFISETLLYISTSRPLTQVCEHMCLTLPSVTGSFLFGGRKRHLLSQWCVMHVYGSTSCLCTDTNATTPCSANVSPIQLNGWVMPLPTRGSHQ